MIEQNVSYVELIKQLLTVFSPFILAVAKQPSWATWQRVSVHLVYSMLVAYVTLATQGKLTLNDWVYNTISILGFGFAFYIGLKKSADKLELATSPSKNRLRSLGKNSVSDSLSIMDNQYK